MAIKTKEELLAGIRGILGENTSDEALGFLDDLSDTVDDLNNANKDNTDWKARYEQNDADWRKKYRERFYSMSKEDTGDSDDNGDEYFGGRRKKKEEPKETKIEDLFTVKGGK